MKMKSLEVTEFGNHTLPGPWPAQKENRKSKAFFLVKQYLGRQMPSLNAQLVLWDGILHF